jgi:mRNA interferase RelE/StbE
MVEVVVSDRAADWLRDAEPDVRDRITNKLHDITDFPDHFLKRLSGSPYYRLRVSDYRVISTGEKTMGNCSFGRSVIVETSTIDRDHWWLERPRRGRAFGGKHVREMLYRESYTDVR